MEERTGEAFDLSDRLTGIGRQLRPGGAAPDFSLDYFDPESSTMQTVRLADSAGMVRLLNTINSLDTPVCHVATRRWEELRADLPANVRVYTVSMDLPFAQARWLTAERVAHQALSAHRSEKFGQDYGVLIKEWRLLQRAVIVIDRNDRIVHSEYVADQMREPNYTEAEQMARKAARGQSNSRRGADCSGPTQPATMSARK